MSNSAKFFLKTGYIENTSTSSLDSDDRSPCEFWTQERLSTSAYYQHHVYRFSSQFAKKQNLTRISDVGCGPALKTAKFFPENIYTVTLYDQESCRSICARQMPSADFISVNLEDSVDKLEQGSGDLVVCSDVIEHLIDPSNCIQLCRKIVRSSGSIIFSTPERDNLRGKSCMRSGHPQHVREWNRDEFLSLLSNSGLKVEKSLLLPQHALKTGENTRYSLTRGFHNPKKYRSCHLVVCTVL